MWWFNVNLGIESSCDETAAAVVENGRKIVSSVVATQIEKHKIFGGVVPEIASRMHTEAICAVTKQALSDANCKMSDIDAIAVTYAPGLIGALLVGVNYAKGLSLSSGVPLVPVHHLRSHIAANYLSYENLKPPFLCLVVSGGNTLITEVKDYTDFKILGRTRDDAAGEAIDKCSKVMGLGYPGGPIIDRLARQGNPLAYKFSEPHIPGLDYSFSGLKTSFLYSLRKWVQDDPDFVEHHKNDLAASLEHTIVNILMKKLRLAVKQTGIKHVAVAGGVSANNGLRNAFHDHAKRFGWTIYIPKFSYTTDNAAMIGITGYYKYLDKDFCSIDKPAFSKVTFK